MKIQHFALASSLRAGDIVTTKTGTKACVAVVNDPQSFLVDVTFDDGKTHSIVKNKTIKIKHQDKQ